MVQAEATVVTDTLPRGWPSPAVELLHPPGTGRLRPGHALTFPGTNGSVQLESVKGTLAQRDGEMLWRRKVEKPDAAHSTQA
jgi:hypothetical protein